MGKVIFWIVIVFAVLFVLRLLNAQKARQARDASGGTRTGSAHPTVRCASCGVYVPRSDAKPGRSGLTCGDPVCLSR